ncbi:DUF2254 domain-containing protein [Sphingomonas sp.]|uniref:DUF2254 domain-containing protein n=1 Tax=Sphingomonas sp. TaxID=28214 RepID=UPI0017D51B0E|nr:DUF2254 domain-containing protein [Sphingomonas sp.]MBA3510762.1 DUF2254 domain-containing protein [Sphingomonas sp.]
MRAHFFRLIEGLRASYWFVPSLMAFFAIVLGALMVWLDAGPATGLLDGLGWYQKAKPDGAHQVLSTIAGSMITVAGVVFSITIVAIAYAASQYGPRILTNFMSDRGNQVTLGTFIATFVYCLVVLRTIRGGGDGEFVPQMAVAVGLVLAICSIAVLIYFIHHVPNSIHINNVVARIGKQLLRSVDDRFPAQVGDPIDEAEQASEELSAGERALQDGTGAKAVCAHCNGYLQAVEDEALMDIACDKDLVLRLHHIPGDYLFDGEMIVSAWPAERVDEATGGSLRRSYSVGNNRTPTQDILFLVDELVEISARALSSGVNDPYTAITCLDWLGAAVAQLGRRRMPSPRRVDPQGTVRVIAVPDSYAGFIDRGFGRMRPYVARDVTAALHMLDTLAQVAARCRLSDRRQLLAAQAESLLTLAEEELHGPSLERLQERYRQTAHSFIATDQIAEKAGTLGARARR